METLLNDTLNINIMCFACLLSNWWSAKCQLQVK